MEVLIIVLLIAAFVIGKALFKLAIGCILLFFGILFVHSFVKDEFDENGHLRSSLLPIRLLLDSLVFGIPGAIMWSETAHEYRDWAGRRIIPGPSGSAVFCVIIGGILLVISIIMLISKAIREK